MFIVCVSQVNKILQANEFTNEFIDSSVKCYESNQLASNNPLEDRRSEASCLYTPGTDPNNQNTNSASLILDFYFHRRYTYWCI